MKHFLLFFFGFLVLAVGGAHEAQAQRKSEKFGAAKALPDIPFMSEDEFKSKTRLVRNKSPNDEFIAYEIRVPNNWTEIEQDNESLSLSLKLMNTLVVYESPLETYNHKSVLQIQAIELPSTITPERWLLEHMLALGYHIEYMGIYSDTRAEAIIAYVDKGQSYIERVVVEINGKRAMLASYAMPIEAWNAYKALQAQVLDSFESLNQFKGEVQNLKDYEFLDIASIKYPHDWTLSAKEIESVDHMEANILNVPQLSDHLRDFSEIDGRVEVALVSIYGTQNLTSEIAKQREEFENHNFKYDESHEVEIKDAYRIHPAFEFAEIKAYKSPHDMMKKTLEKEIWFAVLGAGDYYYFIKMLTPSRSSEYYTWLRNAEVYKTVLENIKPNLKTKALE